MKWITHEVFAVTGAMALGLPLVAVGTSVIGAVLPDMIDFARAGKGKNKQARFNSIHRGASHFWGWYVLIMIVCMGANLYPPLMDILLDATGATQVLDKKSLALLSEGGVAALFGLFFGAIMHIIGDMFTPSGVPYLPMNWKKRVSLKLFSTGSMGEYVFLVLCVLVFVLFFGQESLSLYFGNDVMKIFRRF